MLRWIAIIVLVLVAILLKVAADSLPIEGGAGLLWRSVTYVVILSALIFVCMKLLEKKKPPEGEG